MTDRDESLYWYLRLPDDIALGMVNTIAAGRGDTKPRYTRHSHELTMNGYRADVDLAMKFLAKAGYAVVERAALRALVDAALDTMATGIESAALDAAVLPFLSELSCRASAAPAATEEDAG